MGYDSLDSVLGYDSLDSVFVVLLCVRGYIHNVMGHWGSDCVQCVYGVAVFQGVHTEHG